MGLNMEPGPIVRTWLLQISDERVRSNQPRWRRKSGASPPCSSLPRGIPQGPEAQESQPGSEGSFLRVPLAPDRFAQDRPGGD